MSETGHTYSLRVLARRSDGQMFSFAEDDLRESDLAGELATATACMRDRETWFPDATFADDERALFAWRHVGWGKREPFGKDGA